jgi:hypothetical protein
MMPTLPHLPELPAIDPASMRAFLTACIRQNLRSNRASRVNDDAIVLETYGGHEAITLTRDAQGNAYAHAVDAEYESLARVIDRARIPFSDLTKDLR